MKKLLLPLIAIVVSLAGCGSHREADNEFGLQDLIWSTSLDGHGLSIAGTGLILSQRQPLPGGRMLTHSTSLGAVPLKNLGIDYFPCEYEDEP